MKTRIIFSTLATLLLATTLLFAQESKFNLDQDSSELRVDGTSNIHDWGADAGTIQAELLLKDFEGDIQSLKPGNFKSLTVTVPVKDLDSGKRKLTKNMHSYLEEDDHPNIRFVLNKVTEIKPDGEGVLLTAEGVVNAAGEDHSVIMTVSATNENSGSIVFSGTQDLKMTDFGIDPPTAIFGTVRSADEISVSYSIKFSR